MNILFLTYQGDVAGSTNSISYLVRGLSEKGHNVYLGCREDSLLYSYLENSKVKLIPMIFKNKYDKKTIKQIADVVKKNDIQVINAQSGKDRYLSIFAKIFYKLNVVLVNTRRQPPIFTSKILQPLFYNTFVDAIVGVSNQVKIELQKNGIKEEKLKVIYNGTPEYKYDVIDEDVKKELEERYAIKDTDIVIGSVSRKKKQEQIIEAMANLPENYKLVLVGIESSVYEEQIEKLKLENRVIFVGMVDSAKSLNHYSIFDVLVLASVQEGLSQTLLEGMYLGVPVIATRAAGNIDLINDNENGLFFEDEDIKGLSQAILKITQNNELKEKLIKNGMKTARVDFSIEKVIDGYEELFQELINDRKKGNNMNILITGGAGFIGSNLVEKLIKENNIINIDNFNDFYDEKIKIRNVLDSLGVKENNISLNDLVKHVNKENYKLEILDIRDKKKLGEVFQNNKIDVVIHLAGMAGVRPSIINPELYEEVNIKGTLNILELMKEYNIKYFICASSSSVYGNNKKVPFAETDNVDKAISPYAMTKKSCEVLAYTYHHLYDINTIMLRFFTVYGARQRPDLAIHKFTKMIYNNEKLPFYGDGSSERDYTYIDDIINGIVRSLEYITKDRKEKIYEIFNLGGSKTISLKRMVETLENEIGIKAILDYKEMQPGDVPRTNADITKSNSMLGYDPQTTFEEGIKKFVNWYKETNNIE